MKTNDWLRRRPAWRVAMFIVLLSSEGGLLFWQQKLAVRRTGAWHKARAEFDRLSSLQPALDANGEARLARDLSRARDTLSVLRQPTGACPDEEVLPAWTQPMDACFDLARFVEQTRARLAAAQIEMKTEEAFGFVGYLREGPSREALPRVRTQRQAATQIVAGLLAAKPQALPAWRWEKERALKSGARLDDGFTFDPALSLRVAGRSETVACRLEFSGTTEVLRRFLEEFSTPLGAVLVRSVEVESFAATTPPGSPPAGTKPEPRASPTPSKFIVVLESILPVEGAGVVST